MAYKVQIAVEARRDAKEYAAFIRSVRFAPKAARVWLDELLAEISTLAVNPYRFAVINEADNLNFPYRAFNFHSHRVVYAVHESDKRVVVHRVWHGARELHVLDRGQS